MKVSVLSKMYTNAPVPELSRAVRPWCPLVVPALGKVLAHVPPLQPPCTTAASCYSDISSAILLKSQLARQLMHVAPALLRVGVTRVCPG